MTERTPACEAFLQALTDQCRMAAHACTSSRERRGDDREMLKDDCHLGRILKAAYAFDPAAFDAWASECLPGDLHHEAADLMRLADLEGQAETLLASRAMSAGPYSLGTLREVLVALGGDAHQGGKKNAGRSARRKARQPTAERSQRKRIAPKKARLSTVSATTRNKVRRIVALWRTSRKLEELRPLLPLALAAKTSAFDLVMTAFDKGPFRASLLPHLHRLERTPSKVRATR